MTKRQRKIEILEAMIKEYELLARYNTSKGDYERYTVLVEICNEVKAKEEAEDA